MKSFLCYCILIVFLNAICVPGFAQTQPAFLGTKTPYSYSSTFVHTVPPAGYEPVFINHTGRHGARFLTKAGSDVEVLQLLEMADRSHFLTPLGKQILASARRFMSIEKNNYEHITLQGATEQQAISKRMLAAYPAVFTGKGVQIFTTYKIRTQQSANAFLASFNRYHADRKFTIMPDSLDNFLRFYDLAPAYQQFKGSLPVQKQLDSLQLDQRTLSVTSKVCKRIFHPSFVDLLQQGYKIIIDKKTITVDASSFTDQLYELFTMQFSITGEMKQKGLTPDSIDFGKAFTMDELKWLDFKNEAEDFLEKGPGNDTLGIQVRVAIPLLADYLNTIDAVIEKRLPVDAVFRFSHAETISPFASLLGIPAASVPVTSIFNYAQHWQSSAIIPLSANIQWILYRNGEYYLIKVLLNEKEVALPIPTNQYPFYEWKEVKAYYLHKMQLLQINPLQDMHQFLLDLQ